MKKCLFKWQIFILFLLRILAKIKKVFKTDKNINIYFISVIKMCMSLGFKTIILPIGNKFSIVEVSFSVVGFRAVFTRDRTETRSLFSYDTKSVVKQTILLATSPS